MRVTQFSKFNMSQFYINNAQVKEFQENTQISSGTI